MTNTESSQTLQVDVGGMYCANCEAIIRKNFEEIPGVRAAEVDLAKGAARVTHDGGVDIARLQAAVREDGYTVGPAGSGARAQNTTRDYIEIGAAFAVLLGVYLLLRQFDVIPNTIGVSENVSLGLAFLIGLVASVSTCMAVTGGLLVAAAAKYNEATSTAPGQRRLTPLIYFNAGRLVSYTVLGGVIGGLGAALTLSPTVSGFVSIVASAAMIVLGLQMLRLLPPFSRLMPNTSRHVTQRLHNLAATEAKSGAFIFGAATFFLPCGFTQALQLYVLANGNAVTGALTMFAFALGTLPALLSLSMLASFAKGGFQRHFLKVAGAAVVVLGALTIQYGAVLMNTASPGGPVPAAITASASTADATAQVLEMRVSGFDYFPNEFTVTSGTPVEWRIDGAGAAGCGRMLTAPGLGIREILSSNGETVIRFTPPAPGDYAFNCGMGMMTPNSAIHVVG